ncbi:MAG TPA: twin-arginine translocase subunit TatC [Candidatus Binatia bacterium]|nr:twin-arginine translocase subunit TatC [Candidatus Binatia bacterium]
MALRVVRNDGERRMTVVEHLQELRRVLIVSLCAWAAATVVAAVFNHLLVSVLEYPLTSLLARQNHLISKPIITSPTELVTVPLKVALVGGLVLSLPVIVWQLWTFVAPGLRPVERRFALPFVVSALVLFGGGACLAYFLMPVWLNLLTGIVGSNAIYFPDLNQYLSFLTLAVVAFGVTFELPIVIVLLGMLGIVSSRWLRRRRRLTWLIIIVGAELVTPGVDPVTPLFLAVPLIALFELSILVLAKPLHR